MVIMGLGRETVHNVAKEDFKSHTGKGFASKTNAGISSPVLPKVQLSTEGLWGRF